MISFFGIHEVVTVLLEFLFFYYFFFFTFLRLCIWAGCRAFCSVYIIVFMVPPDCPGPRAPRGKSCPQTGSSSRLGDMSGPAALLKSACLLGFELELLEEEINPSLSTLPHWLPLEPPQRSPSLLPQWSFKFTSRKSKGDRGKEKENRRECNSSSKDVNMVSGD